MSVRRRIGHGEREAVWSVARSLFRLGEENDWDVAPFCKVVEISMSAQG